MVIGAIRGERAPERALAQHDGWSRRAAKETARRTAPARCPSLSPAPQTPDRRSGPGRAADTAVRYPRKRLPELVWGPCGAGMSRHTAVEKAPPVVGQHQKDVQDLKADRGYGKKVDGHQTGDVILQESPPGLGRRLWLSHHALADGGFGDLKAGFQQLAVDPRGTPVRMAAADRSEQITNLSRDTGPPRLPRRIFQSPSDAK
jgi:hypothetical protein